MITVSQMTDSSSITDSDYQYSVEKFPNRSSRFRGSADGDFRVVNGNQSNGRLSLPHSEKSCDSDGSWGSHATAPSEEIDHLNDETGLLLEKFGKEHKSKKKKTVQKLMKMKNMIKKTFSDVDATPDAEWNAEWKKYSEMQFADQIQEYKPKRKMHKRIPFSDDGQVFSSPSYKQKDDTFHKCFKQLPQSERLLVDCTCALMKDILVQGRIYISQTYLCFHSNILSWQTEIVVQFKDVEQVTKERTVKVIPNAIQFHIKNKEKSLTFTSFTHRDKTYKQIYKIWQNALADKPTTPRELWNSVHNNYDAELGGSSDEDYAKPEDDVASSSKMKRKKKHKHLRHGTSNCSINNVSLQDESKCTQVDQHSEKSKSSSQETDLFGSEEGEKRDNSIAVEDDEPCEHAKEALRREYLVREFPVSAKVLFQTLFDDDSGFMRAYLQGKGSTNVAIEKWRDGAEDYEGNKIRNLSFKLPLTNPLVPKSSHFEELQILYKESEPGRCYSVDGIARSFGVPYSEYFSSIMRYNIRKLTRDTCELKVTAQVKYHKTPWGLVKNFIDKNVHGGMTENFQLFDRQLSSYLSQSRRPNFLSVPRIIRSSSRSMEDITAWSVSADADPKTSTSDVPTIDPSINVLPSQSTHLSFPNANTTCEKQYQHKVEITNGKWFFRILCMVFMLLVWSNYTMYRRIATLEQAHSHFTRDDVTTKSFTDYDVTNPYSDASSKTLQLLDRRLQVVENLIRNLTTTSERRWLMISNEWKELRNTVTELVNRLENGK